MIEPSRYKQYATGSNLLDALRSKVSQADGICILWSDTLENSLYVQTEVQLPGTVVFVNDPSVIPQKIFVLQIPALSRPKSPLLVKHMIIGIIS